MRRNTKGERNVDGNVNQRKSSRRRILRATSAATVGAVGLAATSGSVSAGELKDCTNWPSAPQGYPTVDLTQERPSAMDLNEDALCIFVHGWNGRERSDDQAYALDLSLQNAGYDESMIVASWASDTLNFWQAESNADTAGVRLARWFREEFQGDTSTAIRVVSHSLGARVILGALNELGGDVVIDTVSMVGAAVDNSTVCDSGRYSSGIRSSAHEVYSYRSENDGTVCTIYDFSTIEEGLGCNGANCGSWWSGGSMPSNYHEVNVTDSVPGHCKYFQPNAQAGCMTQVVNGFR